LRRKIAAERAQSILKNLINMIDFAVHAQQLLTHTQIAWRGNEIEVGSQRFQCAKRLPQLMSKISQNVFRTRVSHSQAS
jgi:gamma-glutamyltranspeptidase